MTSYIHILSQESLLTDQLDDGKDMQERRKQNMQSKEKVPKQVFSKGLSALTLSVNSLRPAYIAMSLPSSSLTSIVV
jgi:hypothetical protein